jgi:uncharacterized membrane protein YfcA
LPSAFADISFAEILIIALAATGASTIGGIAGYGTGALMPLVLVPIVGAEPVVPIIALAALFNNGSRIAAFRSHVDWKRAGLILLFSMPTCVLGAYGYTRLTGKGAMIVIGSMLAASVVLRRVLKSRGFALSGRGLAAASVGWGVLVGGTTGAGVMLLSMLMAAGLSGSAVVATDAAISAAMGAVKVATFGWAGAMTAKLVAVALVIGCATVPGAFIARRIVEHLPLHVHGAILDAVVIAGGTLMVLGAILG